MAAAESSSVVSEEALTYMLCLSSGNGAYSEGRTVFSWLSGMFLYGCQWDSGREYLFPNVSSYRWDTWLGLVHLVSVTLWCE